MGNFLVEDSTEDSEYKNPTSSQKKYLRCLELEPGRVLGETHTVLFSPGTHFSPLSKGVLHFTTHSNI